MIYYFLRLDLLAIIKFIYFETNFHIFLIIKKKMYLAIVEYFLID